MIPGLEISEEVENRILEKLSARDDIIIREIRQTGIEGLIERYNTMVLNIESETCWNGANGTLQTGDKFVFCCGISYEYWSVLCSRTYIEDILDLLPDPIKKPIFKRVDFIDRRLKALQDDDEYIWNKNTEKDYPKEKYWWHYGLPRTVEP